MVFWSGTRGIVGWQQEGRVKKARIVFWKDGAHWIGYLEEYPDYRTQGETLAGLKDNLRELHADLTSGEIPCVRRVAEIKVA